MVQNSNTAYLNLRLLGSNKLSSNTKMTLPKFSRADCPTSLPRDESLVDADVDATSPDSVDERRQLKSDDPEWLDGQQVACHGRLREVDVEAVESEHC